MNLSQKTLETLVGNGIIKKISVARISGNVLLGYYTHYITHSGNKISTIYRPTLY